MSSKREKLSDETSSQCELHLKMSQLKDYEDHGYTNPGIDQVNVIARKKSMGPVLIWPNITMVENVFQEILALKKL